jgi:hypothetical protein
VAAVRAAVCDSEQQCVTYQPVCVAVCGSAAVRQSVWQCMQQCAAVWHCDSVQQCSNVVRQCTTVRTTVYCSAAVCGNVAVWQCVQQCGIVGHCMRQSVVVCAVVCLFVFNNWE